MASSGMRLAHLASVRRLPAYTRALEHFLELGWETVSTTHLAQHLNMDAISVRKDLAITGIVGKPGTGYEVGSLLAGVREYLGWHGDSDAFLVGVGHLGTALRNHDGLKRHGLRVIAGFDVHESRIAPRSEEFPVFPMDQMADLARRTGVRIGILTVPAEAAQSATDCMVSAGLKAIWNFAPVQLVVPRGVAVEDEDITSGFAVLSRRLKQSSDM